MPAIRPFAICFALFAAVSAIALEPAAELPQLWPTCPAPQNIAPILPVESWVSQKSAVAWDGREFGVVWANSNGLVFRRFFADGSPASETFTLSALFAVISATPQLVWTGTEYGVSWIVNAGTTQLYFLRFSRSGTPLMTPRKVSFVGLPESSSVIQASMAWGGGGYAITWTDGRAGAGNTDVFATLLDNTGTISGGGALHDLAISNATGDQRDAVIAAQPNGIGYLVAWADYGAVATGEIRTRSLGSNGAMTGEVVTVTGALRQPRWLSLAKGATGFGLAWVDQRDGNYEIYFTTLVSSGYLNGVDTRMTSDVAVSAFPQLAWTGAEFLMVWMDQRSPIVTYGSDEIWMQRIGGNGVAAGGNIQLSSSGGLSNPSFAFSGAGALIIAGEPYQGGLFTIPVGCRADATPPTCAGGYAAWSISGTAATIGWLPASDGESDIAYYNVYRNSQWVGRTATTYFNDNSLSLGGNYAYAIQPVNAMQLQNTACTATINVKTNASLTLTMTKAGADDAGLEWTDAGFNNYNLFRGTSPQVMTQIGATPDLSSTDPGVLPSPVSYFYSVDNPGP